MKAVIERLKALSSKCLSRMKRAFDAGRAHAAALYIYPAVAVVSTSRRGKDAIIRLHYRPRLYIALVVLLLVAYVWTDITLDDSAFFENLFAAIFGATLTFALIDFVIERGRRHEMKPVRAGLMREVQGLSASLQNIIGQLVRRTEAVPSVNVLNECGDPDYDHAFYIARLSDNERKLGEDLLVLQLRNLKRQCNKLVQRYLTHMPPSLVETLLHLENLPGPGALTSCGEMFVIT